MGMQLFRRGLIYRRDEKRSRGETVEENRGQSAVARFRDRLTFAVTIPEEVEQQATEREIVERGNEGIKFNRVDRSRPWSSGARGGHTGGFGGFGSSGL